jgi:hypothetical protein
MGFDLIPVGLEALLGIHLSLDAADKSDPFIAMFLDQMTYHGPHAFGIIGHKHRRAVNIHRLRDDRQVTVNTFKGF